MAHNGAMAIAQYIKDIGRGKDGARALTREQACDLLGQVLDGAVTDLEVGAFCLAMRIKGETAQEMAGFLDAVHTRLQRVESLGPGPTVVLPSYNGARRLPVLSPLLGLLLARRGVPVLMHGQQTEDKRVCAQNVLLAGEFIAQAATKNIAFVSQQKHFEYRQTAQLLPGLARLLDVRRTVGVRNSAHSLVKLMNPVAGAALVLSSYTHPEYLHSMTQTLQLTQGHAMLLRGTEGEAVADARRTPQMDVFLNGQARCVQAQQEGSLQTVPDLPADTSALTCAQYTHDVLAGRKPVPEPIALQVEHILRALDAMHTQEPEPQNHAVSHA
jgi:anthranilate phosphoribosyltransferase